MKKLKYQKSEWYKGLLFAEEQSAQGWVVCGFDYSESWFMWEWPESEAKQTVFGEIEWIQGVLDFYKNRNNRDDEPFKYIPKSLVKK